MCRVLFVDCCVMFVFCLLFSVRSFDMRGLACDVGWRWRVVHVVMYDVAWLLCSS